MNKSSQVIYNISSLHDFTDYGISIPLLNERILNTIKFLEEKYQTQPSKYPEISNTDILLAHTKEFVDRMTKSPDDFVMETYELINSDGSYHRYDPSKAKKPLTDFILKAKQHVAGTYMTCSKAIEEGFSYHLGGGMHHAMSFKPSGFCMFNDLVISLRKLQKEEKIRKAIIIDLDCHKGDGASEILNDDDSITTISIHMANGWPLSEPKQNDSGEINPSFIPSDIDIPIKQDDDYLGELDSTLSQINWADYDLALVVHGVDTFEGDVLESSAGIQLSKSEVLKRDLLVSNRLTAAKLPQAWCLGGGYGPLVHELYIQFLDNILEK